MPVRAGVQLPVETIAMNRLRTANKWAGVAKKKNQPAPRPERAADRAAAVTAGEHFRIKFGTEIAIGNRSKTTGKLRYAVPDTTRGTIVLDEADWATFEIAPAATPSMAPGAAGSTEQLHYGQRFRLLGVKDAEFSAFKVVGSRIEKVDPTEPVDQLQKVALTCAAAGCPADAPVHILSWDAAALGLVELSAEAARGSTCLTEAAIWWMGATDGWETTFIDGRAPPNTPLPIFPAPRVETTVQAHGKLELLGFNFRQGITVWFGNCPSENVVVRTSEQLVCQVPARPIAAGALKVPLFLAMSPDVFFKTECSFTYPDDPTIGM